MQENTRIPPPLSPEDFAGARRVFSDFLDSYQHVFARVNYYLEQMINQVDPVYSHAYKPWHRSLHELFEGVYFIQRDVPLSDTEYLREAIMLFSFDSAGVFLNDVCASCGLSLPPGWPKRFNENIHTLHFAFNVLQGNDSAAISRVQNETLFPGG